MLNLLGFLVVLINCWVRHEAQVIASDSFERLSVIKLPMLNSMSYPYADATKISLFLHNIPLQLAEEDRVELTLWKYVNNTAASQTFYSEYTMMNINDADGYFDRDHEFVVLIRKSFQISGIDQDTQVRLVMRLTPFPLDSGLNSPPSPICVLASFCEDTVLHSPRRLDWALPVASVYPQTITKYGDLGQSLVQHVNISLAYAFNNLSNLPDELLSHRGMSGAQFRHFMNNIGQLDNARYLELGVFYGSTLFSLLFGNKVNAVAIDSWSGQDMPGSDSNAYDVVVNGVEKYRGDNIVDIIQGNTWDIIRLKRNRILHSLNGKANIYFYDAAHQEIDQFMALTNYIAVLDDVFIYIVDDWDMPFVKDGTFAAVNALNLDVLLRIEIQTAGVWDENMELKRPNWHNGMAVFVLGKGAISV